MLPEEYTTEIKDLFTELYPDRQLTTHVQVGQYAYLVALDKIVEQDKVWDTVSKMKDQSEIVDSAQGEGVVTIWWDGTNRLAVTDTAVQLQYLGSLFRTEWYKMLNAVYDEFYKRHPHIKEAKEFKITLKRRTI